MGNGIRDGIDQGLEHRTGSNRVGPDQSQSIWAKGWRLSYSREQGQQRSEQSEMSPVTPLPPVQEFGVIGAPLNVRQPGFAGWRSKIDHVLPGEGFDRFDVGQVEVGFGGFAFDLGFGHFVDELDGDVRVFLAVSPNATRPPGLSDFAIDQSISYG